MSKPAQPHVGADMKKCAPTLEQLQSIIAKLCDQNAELAAPVEIQHAKRLWQRAQTLSPLAQPLVCMQLDRHLQQLADRLHADRQQAEQTAKRLCALGYLNARLAEDLLATGNYARLRQLSRCYPRQSPRIRQQLHAKWQAALAAEVEQRGLSTPGALDAPSDEQSKRSPAELATALYRETATHALASLTIVKAVEALPAAAGRYHAGTVATRTLQAMQAVPNYLRAQLERLECLAAMEALAPPAAPENATGLQSRKRRPKTRKSQVRAAAVSKSKHAKPTQAAS